MATEQMKAIERIADKRYTRGIESGEPEAFVSHRIAKMLRNKEAAFRAKEWFHQSEWCRNLAEAYEIVF